MPALVIHRFEMVNIQEQQGKGAPVTGSGGNGALEQAVEPPAIIDVGQVVPLRRPAFGKVPDQGIKPHYGVVGVINRDVLGFNRSGPAP